MESKTPGSSQRLDEVGSMPLTSFRGSVSIAEIRTQLELDRVKQDLNSSRATLDHVNGAKISAETLTIQVSAELKAEVASLRRAETELKAQSEVSFSRIPSSADYRHSVKRLPKG